MRRHTILVAFALAVVILVAPGSVVLAQHSTSNRPIQFIVSGGLTLPQGDLANFHDTGYHADASVLVRALGVKLRPELSLTRLKQQLTDAVGVPLPGSDSLGTTQFLGALGNIELPLAGGLYVLGGVGVLNMNASSENATKFTMNAGAGFRFHLGSAQGFVEARLGTASYDEGVFGYSQAKFIPISFGLAF